jgi:DNA repair protein RadD
MQLRLRQTAFVERCTWALIQHGNTLGVAPTGSGKTVMLSAVASDPNGWNGPACVLQHRDELVDQNRSTLHAFNSNMLSDLYTADRKHWLLEGTTFAMAQTLMRPENLKTMPPLGLLCIDEAHHSASDSYLRIIDHALKTNPACKLLGVTATPNRGDKKALLGVFSNCADQISIKELIDTGFLVKPRSFVIDVGTQEELKGVKRQANDFDMDQVARIMDKQVINERVVEEWRKVAEDRQTVVFCSTLQHAYHVKATFEAAGISVGWVHHELSDKDRADVLAAFDQGEIRVMVNVAVLTEGWDCQPVSCIVLLRPSSYKSTMIQMIGRGLRKVDPERYPGVQKDDCLVLDFGTSILLHGSIEQEVYLEGEGLKTCHACSAVVPMQCKVCPICGAEFPVEEPEEEEEEKPEKVRKVKAELDRFTMTEIELINLSPYRWESMFEGLCWVANALDAWAVVVRYAGRWIALGGRTAEPMRVLGDNLESAMALVSADDFLREQGDPEKAAKIAAWMGMAPSDKQLKFLGLTPMQAMGINRYRAACCMTWLINERGIKRRLEDYKNRQRIAA